MSQVVKRFGPLNYSRCKMVLQRKKRDKDCGEVTIGPNTRLHRHDREGEVVYEVSFHGSYIMSFHADGRIVLDSCGYRSVTTKQRMNALLHGVSVWQKRGEWFVTLRRTGETVPFTDGINVGAQTVEEMLAAAARNGDQAARAMLHDLREDRAAV